MNDTWSDRPLDIVFNDAVKRALSKAYSVRHGDRKSLRRDVAGVFGDHHILNGSKLTKHQWTTLRRIADLEKDLGDLELRLEVGQACGPRPHDLQRAERLSWLRAVRAAWETYLDAAYQLGFFVGVNGVDLLRRLQSPSSGMFRQAMNECMVAWWLAAVAKISVSPRAMGNKQHVLEMSVQNGSETYCVEVKSPTRTAVSRVFRTVDYSTPLARSLQEANKQFSTDAFNVLFLVPHVEHADYYRLDRDSLIQAFFGHWKVVFEIDTRGRQSRTKDRFHPDGAFAKERKGARSFTRTGAVFCLEERLFGEGTERWFGHYAVGLHNPFARRSIAKTFCAGIPMFEDTGNGMMRWTDFEKFRPN